MELSKQEGRRLSDIQRQLKKDLKAIHGYALKIAVRKLKSVLQKIDEYDLIAKELSDLLLANWNKSYEDAISKAIYVINNQTSPTVTKAEIDNAITLMQNIVGKDYANIVSDDVRKVVEETYNLGRGAFISKSAVKKDELENETIRDIGASYAFDVIDYAAIDWLHETNIYWIGKHYEKEVIDRLRKAGYEIIEQGLSRDNAGKLLAETFKDQFEKSTGYWKNLSNHIVTDSRTFGEVESLVLAQVDKYRIDAVLDDRTTDLCRYLDAETKKNPFSTSNAVTLRDERISAPTPEAAIRIKPWIPYDAKKDTPPDLNNKAYWLPPFHFGCRSRIVAIT